MQVPYVPPGPNPPVTGHSIVAGFAMVLVLFAILVAVSYPVAAILSLAVIVVAYPLVRGFLLLRRTGRLSVPGTDLRIYVVRTRDRTYR